MRTDISSVGTGGRVQSNSLGKQRLGQEPALHRLLVLERAQKPRLQIEKTVHHPWEVWTDIFEEGTSPYTWAINAQHRVI